MAHISDAGGQWKTTVEITNVSALSNSCPGAAASYTTIPLTTCVTMPNGSILAFVEVKYSGSGDFVPQDVFVFHSYDGGLTWTSPELLLDSVADSDVYNGKGVQNGTDDVAIWANAVVAGNRVWAPITVKPTTTTGPTGKAYDFIMYSDDNGSTWSKLLNLTDICNLTDKFDNYVSVGNVGNIIYLQNGRLVFPAWFYNQSHNNYDLFALYTDNQEDGLNATFNTTSVFGTSEEFSEWSIVQLKNYTLYGTVRGGAKAGGPAYRYSTWSTDNGSTWTEPTYPDTSLLDPESKGSIIRYTIDTEYDKNRILLAWNNDSSSRNHLTVAISYDECQSFPVRRELGDGLEYPYLCITDNMSIICSYRHGGVDSSTAANLDIFNLEWLSNGSDYLVPPSNTSASDTENFGISLPVDYTATPSSHEYSIASFGISLPIDHTAADNNGSGFIISDSNSFYATIAGLAVFFPILGLLVYKEKRR